MVFWSTPWALMKRSRITWSGLAFCPRARGKTRPHYSDCPQNRTYGSRIRLLTSFTTLVGYLKDIDTLALLSIYSLLSGL